MSGLAARYDSLIMDADGVIYRGNQAVEHAVEVLGMLGQSMPWSIVTNNAAHPPASIAAKTTALGLPLADDRVVTSPHGAVEYLSNVGLPPGSAVFVVGGNGIDQALREGGYLPVRDRHAHPQTVVQGFGPDVGWSQLAEACYLIDEGALWIATNLDASIPTAEGFAPGNGSLVAAITHALGRRPDAATGKPEPLLFQIAAARMNAERSLVVGDRIDTDIRGGNAAGMDTMLVLTGVSGPEQIAELASGPREDRPTYLARDLRALISPATDSLIVQASPLETDGLSEVRALLAAAWADPTVAEHHRRVIEQRLHAALGY